MERPVWLAGILLVGAGVWYVLKLRRDLNRPVPITDNEYFPVQSSSERAAGHPIVGVS